jgi:hypothetical protein
MKEMEAEEERWDRVILGRVFRSEEEVFFDNKLVRSC